MILDSRKGAKRRKEVEIPFTQISNIFEKSIRAIRVICVPRNKLISTRLYFFEHESHRSHEFYNP